ncbi:hypothetical protein MMC10_007143 [Thelotrema lepadinum]|nr:hypothetical protein [Thelotrema lepadinum]
MSPSSLEEGLLNSEKETSWRPVQARRSLSWGEIGRIIWTVILIVASVEVVWRDFRAIHHRPSSASKQVHGDLEFGFTSQKKVSTTFKHNITFIEAPSSETDEAWKALFPDGNGYVEDVSGKFKAYGTSAFHQLHCLDILRHVFYGTDPHSELAVVTRDETSQMKLHAKHCFDYLRQSLMCAADSTLEPVDAVTDTMKEMRFDCFVKIWFGRKHLEDAFRSGADVNPASRPIQCYRDGPLQDPDPSLQY